MGLIVTFGGIGADVLRFDGFKACPKGNMLNRRGCCRSREKPKNSLAFFVVNGQPP